METKYSCIFRSNWVEAAQSIIDKALRCEYYEALMHYAMTGEKKSTPPELNLALGIIYSLIDLDRDKYEKKVEKRREAGIKGNQVRWGESQKSQDIAKVANATKASQNIAKVANVADTVTDTDTATGTDKDKSLNKLPHTPIEEEGSFFEEYYKKVKAVKVPQEVEDSNYTAQYVWRMAEGNPHYGLSVQKAIETAPSRESFEGSIQALNRRHQPHADFLAVKLALAMKRLNKQQEAAALAEIRHNQNEQDIFKTMLEKVEYINKGGNVTSLQGFFKSRR